MRSGLSGASDEGEVLFILSSLIKFTREPATEEKITFYTHSSLFPLLFLSFPPAPPILLSLSFFPSFSSFSFFLFPSFSLFFLLEGVRTFLFGFLLNEYFWRRACDFYFGTVFMKKKSKQINNK